MRYFYSHLVEIEPLITELDQLDLTEDQKHHLAQLADANIHQAVLDAIFSELSPQEKIIFFEHIRQDDHDKIWKLLNERVDKIEEKIKKAAGDVRDELHQDLKEARRLK
jgi:hypothetical protein